MTALADKLRAIEEIVGPPNLLTATDAVATYRVDGQQPLAVASPATPEELAAVLRHASDSRLSVLLRGAGRHSYIGAPPGPIGIILSLARLNRVLDFDHENLTITAQAGATLASLQQAAAQRNQIVPLDPPGGDHATIGGIAATNLSGPLRSRYGPPRDLVIGLRVAFADGALVKTGGKTVKNVAGYELTKLFLGSWGTLGALCEVTVRTTPRPETKAMLTAALAPDRAREISRDLLASRLEVPCLALSDPLALRRMRLHLPVTIDTGMQVLLVGLMGDKAAVERQTADLKRLLPTAALLTGDAADEAWRALRECPYPSDPGDVMARIGVPLSQSPNILQLVARLDGWWALARMGDGTVHLGPPAQPTPDALAPLGELRRAAEAVGGYLVLESAPLELKRGFSIWGSNRNADLMRALKDSYDPRGTLGCGRYSGM
ncbi:MAG: FAD-binding oxidoreductase [Armatimonadota bacterium]